MTKLITIDPKEVRKKGVLTWLRPDAKSQVTFRYEDHKPVGIEAVVLSTQHTPDISAIITLLIDSKFSQIKGNINMPV